MQHKSCDCCCCLSCHCRCRCLAKIRAIQLKTFVKCLAVCLLDSWLCPIWGTTMQPTVGRERAGGKRLAWVERVSQSSHMSRGQCWYFRCDFQLLLLLLTLPQFVGETLEIALKCQTISGSVWHFFWPTPQLIESHLHLPILIKLMTANSDNHNQQSSPRHPSPCRTLCKSRDRHESCKVFIWVSFFVLFFVGFLLILIAFWCIQEASRQFACESDPESSAEWLSCSVAVAVAVGCTLLAFGIDWKIDCLDKEPNEFLPFAVAQLQLQVVQVAAVATSRCRYPSHSRIIVLPVAQKKSADRGTLSLSRFSICKCEQFPGQLAMHRSFASSPSPSLSLSLSLSLAPFHALSFFVWRCCLRRLSFGFD